MAETFQNPSLPRPAARPIEEDIPDSQVTTTSGLVIPSGPIIPEGATQGPVQTRSGLKLPDSVDVMGSATSTTPVIDKPANEQAQEIDEYIGGSELLPWETESGALSSFLTNTYDTSADALDAVVLGTDVMLRAAWRGYNRHNVNFWERLDNISGAFVRTWNDAVDVLDTGYRTAAGLGPDAEEGEETFEGFPKLSQSDLFLRLRNDAIRIAESGEAYEYDHIFLKTLEVLGETAPMILEAMAVRGGVVNGLAARGATTIQQIVAGVTSMGVYGTATHGWAGGADFAAMDMLNVALGPYSRLASSLVLSHYMAGMAVLRGGTSEDIQVNAILGGFYGLAGTAGNKRIFDSMREPLIKWVQRQPPIEIPELGMTPALAKMLEQRGARALAELYPAVYAETRMPGKSRIPDTAEGMRDAYARKIAKAAELDPASMFNHDGTINEARVREATKTMLIRADRNHEMPPNVMDQITLGMVNALKRGDVDALPFGLKGPQAFGETAAGQRARIAEEIPVLSADATGAPVLAKAGQPLRSQVTMPDGTTVMLDQRQAGPTQRAIGEYTSSRDARETGHQKLVPALIEHGTRLLQRTYEGAVGSEGNLYKKLISAYGNDGMMLSMMHNSARSTSVQGIRDAQTARDAVFRGADTSVREGINLLVDVTNRLGIARRRGGGDPKLVVELELAQKGIVEGLDPAIRGEVRVRTERYFQENLNMLELAKTEGVLSNAEFNSMKEILYSPTLYVAEMQKLFNENLSYNTPSVLSTPKNEINFLTEHAGSGARIVDAEALMLFHQYSMREMLAKHRVTREFGRLAETEQSASFTIAKEDANGKPIVPEGRRSIAYKDDGVTKHVLMSEENFVLWNKNPWMSRKAHRIAQVLSGTILLRPLVTTVNPTFALASFTRDMMFAYMADSTGRGWSTNPVMAAAQMTNDLRAVALDVVLRKGRVEEFYRQANGFISFHDMVADTLAPQQAITDYIGTAKTPIRNGWRATVNVLSYVGTTGELMMRISQRERWIKNGMNPTEASLRAHSMLNFSRSGEGMRMVNDYIPFANATAQALDSLAKSQVDNPALFQEKLLGLMAVEGALYGYNVFMNPDGWRQVNERVKTNEYVIMLPAGFASVDESGNIRHSYISFRKENSFLTTPYTALLHAMLDNGVYGKENASIYFNEAAKSSLPFRNVAGFAGMPSANAVLALAGKRPWLKPGAFFDLQDVWKGPEVEPSAEYTRRTNEFYVGLGQKWGMSPTRLQASVNALAPSVSPVGWITHFAEPERTPISDPFLMQFMANTPGLQRVVHQTHRYDEHAAAVEDAAMLANTDRYTEVTMPMESMFIAVRRGTRGLDGGMSIQEARRAVRGQDRDLYARFFQNSFEEVNPQTKQNMVASLEGFIRSETAWDRALKKFGQEILDHLPSSMLLARMSAIDGKESAELYYTIWSKLIPAERRVLDNIRIATGGSLRGSEFNQTFRQLLRDGGEPVYQD